jgi:methionine synthase I (cobalamin-dependent)
MASAANAPQVLLLDGGMGHLLKQTVPHLPGLPFDQQFLASCLAVQSSPDAVTRAHAAYIAAGCGVLTTSSFVATAHNLGKVGRAGDQQALIEVRVRCAPAWRSG